MRKQMAITFAFILNCLPCDEIVSLCVVVYGFNVDFGLKAEVSLFNFELNWPPQGAPFSQAHLQSAKESF